ncbi:MAG: DUF819 family protein [Saprospiraceae bacterium]|nr:DUF819 family protein [Saprospiraceae bacterium]
MQLELIGILVVAITLAFVIWLEHNNKRKVFSLVLQWIPAILFAYILPATITHLFNIDLSHIQLHDLSKTVLMPVAIVLVMSALSIKQLRLVGLRPIVVFVSGSAAVALLPFLLLPLLDLFGGGLKGAIIGEEQWRGLVTIVGSWIGGSTSQLILKELAHCPEGLFLVILVMDNVLVNLWTILMFQKIKRSESINRMLDIQDPPIDVISDIPLSSDHTTNQNFLTIGLATTAVVLTAMLLEDFLVVVVLLSLLGLLFGNVLKFWNHGLVIKLGGYFIILIMALLGLKLDFHTLHIPFTLLIFSIIWLLLHYVVMMILAYLLRLNMAWVPIASMANVGGISTAPAVTKAYNEEWMPHAILLAILSMVTGTYWGMLSIYLFELLY